MQPIDARRRVALRKWLTCAVDTDRPYTIRLAAIRAIQRSLTPRNPLRLESAERLLDRTLPDWAVRGYLEDGRRVERKVTRPPLGLLDVWT
jgi:hypothetical protein